MDQSSINGFSLVEIFFAIFIISITIIVMAFFTKNSFRNYSNAYSTENAFVAAENKLAELSANPFPADGNDQMELNHLIYNRDWTINKNDTFNRATITVSWALMGKTQEILLSGAVK